VISEAPDLESSLAIRTALLAAMQA
jgi:hypothetical protein